MSIKTIITGALVLCAVVVFINLGFWQLDRLQWKTDLIQKIDAEKNVDATTVPLASLIDNADNNMRRGYLNGTWVDAGSARVGPKAANDQWGYWVITPFKLDDGAIILVNRGWVDDKRIAGLPPKGAVQIMGTLRASDGKGKQIAGDARLFHVLDVQEIARSLGQDNVAKLAFFMDGSVPADDPALQAAPITAQMRNAHRQYAIFWFSAAGLLIALCVIFSLRGKRSASSPDPSVL